MPTGPGTYGPSGKPIRSLAGALRPGDIGSVQNEAYIAEAIRRQTRQPNPELAQRVQAAKQKLPRGERRRLKRARRQQKRSNEMAETASSLMGLLKQASGGVGVGTQQVSDVAQLAGVRTGTDKKGNPIIETGPQRGVTTTGFSVPEGGTSFTAMPSQMRQMFPDIQPGMYWDESDKRMTPKMRFMLRRLKRAGQLETESRIAQQVPQ